MFASKHHLRQTNIYIKPVKLNTVEKTHYRVLINEQLETIKNQLENVTALQCTDIF